MWSTALTPKSPGSNTEFSVAVTAVSPSVTICEADPAVLSALGGHCLLLLAIYSHFYLLFCPRYARNYRKPIAKQVEKNKTSAETRQWLAEI